ncbi:sensor domain-containing protein [Cellulomonas sp. DKR-3]|uniref:Sensor domain-containing protein n=1 Tax=Cellulomonas fulva TaxID=2835530 RepID=A0ABS5U1W2_9CELL|nr:sensor domain-containing protein [Cellulomonas fulva]MBT0995393.1 sensor domain-containing protein [Cellulomonas fulva]
MTSTEPRGPDASPPPTTRSGTPAARRSWWWAVVVAAVVVAVLLLVVQPWGSHETEPVIVPTTASPTPTAPPTGPAPRPSPTPTVPPVPGEEAEFDDDALHLLFVRQRELQSVVPAAEDGVTAGIRPGELTWGLPQGSSVDPAQCNVAVTVVDATPPGFDARSWGNDAMEFTQTLTRLDDAAQAQEAFRDLVTAVDGCPTYAQVNPGTDGARWAAQPAIEGQGTYPSIVQEVVHVAEGARTPTYRGHLLVGNVIVSWTAAAVAEGDDDAARLATLGPPEALSMMVQDRARLAVQSLG